MWAIYLRAAHTWEYHHLRNLNTNETWRLLVSNISNHNLAQDLATILGWTEFHLWAISFFNSKVQGGASSTGRTLDPNLNPIQMPPDIRYMFWLLGPMVLGRSTRKDIENAIHVRFGQPSEYKASINMHLYYIEKALLCSALSHFKFCAFINMVFIESKM